MMLKKEKPVMPVSVLIQGSQRGWVQPGSNEGVSGMSSVGRQSPLDITQHPVSFSSSNGGPASPSVSSPTFTIGSSSNGGTAYIGATSPGGNSSASAFASSHPLSGSKHLCSICGDRASGKHYGVYSCEGCKGFFKRTVRKELAYSCREKKECIIDKRQRNRCQYCRYKKCLNMGMKREAVQEERQRTKVEHKAELAAAELHHSNGTVAEMPINQIRDAETLTDPDHLLLIDQKPDLNNYYPAAKDQMEQIVLWAKNIPHFRTLPLEDQLVLLKQGWNELLIATFSHRSMNADGAIILSNGIRVDRSTMQDYGLDGIFDRVLSELVAKMKELQMDKAELGCLKAIVLYNPDAKNLCMAAKVELLREKVYVALEDYTKTKYPDQAGRFPKLLLRMPALRSIGLKCTEHLFFLKDWHNYPKLIDTPIDKYLLNFLGEESNQTINMSS